MPPLDITGRRFGKLIATRFSHLEAPRKGRQGRRHVWLCICDCGIETKIRKENLTSGNSTSCGCGKYVGLDAMTHGYSKHRLAGGENPKFYRTWSMMLDRCRNPRNKSYKYYGGRGIRVCERWHTFENFLADMGQRPSGQHSIDRINNDGDYEPDNCRWATQIEQRHNRRDSMSSACK